jgi:hypothetical protein
MINSSSLCHEVNVVFHLMHYLDMLLQVSPSVLYCHVITHGKLKLQQTPKTLSLFTYETLKLALQNFFILSAV